MRAVLSITEAHLNMAPSAQVLLDVLLDASLSALQLDAIRAVGAIREGAASEVIRREVAARWSASPEVDTFDAFPARMWARVAFEIHQSSGWRLLQRGEWDSPWADPPA